MDFDDIALARFDDLKKEWVSQCSKSAQGICDLANRYRQRDDCLLRSMHSGSFNFSFRLHWEDDGEDWLIRFPLRGKSMFLDEKIIGEAVLMKYLREKTNIPVPEVIAYGAGDENPTGLGPFIIMTWIEGRKMSDVLRKEGGSEKEEVLDPHINEAVLESLYGQMAGILLELWKLDFDRIGCLALDEGTGEFQITKPPITLATNELIRTCGLDHVSTSSRVYNSSVEYIHSLLTLQSTHLTQQRNSIYDAEDCREKYTCRHLMKAIALNFIPTSSEETHGPFKLFCDDLCPGNVLVNDQLQVVAVIDWEFSYAAPAQFAGSIPWWLLLDQPHRIVSDRGGEGFLELFLPKADAFLRVLERREEEEEEGVGVGVGVGVGGKVGDDGKRLSMCMRASLRDRSAWFALAVRMVHSVDLIYWDLLDEFCWGAREKVAERVYGVTTGVEMHRRREGFVREKVDQLRGYFEELGVERGVEACVFGGCCWFLDQAM
ncbi:hypothetical protein BO70DRAFT_385428 [Aspergillus heteromorphus CBS 117.55]|uniref:Aminoglycoside phosphotransferase domain-containing protein n=1 Tax=Aspergillus heteromorphus CBS 117.55 TaxID=1448321 RepID=A0A317WNX7_9EURO|nr:uncharacterized protein BO70DRAFT_385428 [Aspergillus heteromorphus CBS 117.55]PWY88189.1 hypothetical protein BO70DRAFT_385428 [Aspergillus heteromorphus CBS 117.55]